mmetsp:Transcript_40316/g.106945  ORF Transcript_40316/g.106945 Transcript_40316/m.106945 type:complete len:147 (-) Transcript_40316:69-509(-)
MPRQVSRSPRRRDRSHSSSRRSHVRGRSRSLSKSAAVRKRSASLEARPSCEAVREAGGADIGKAEVVESKARQSTGERTFRAEIQMPKSMRFNYDGKARTMYVRGPLRVNREQAERDAERLQQEAKSGDTAKVKAVAREMLQSNVS